MWQSDSTAADTLGFSLCKTEQSSSLSSYVRVQIISLIDNIECNVSSFVIEAQLHAGSNFVSCKDDQVIAALKANKNGQEWILRSTSQS
jgi:hypothetical protein